MLRPAVLLLDEPLGALDAKIRKQLRLELKTLQEEVGITFVFVTHDQEEALSMSDRVAVMSDGRIEQVGTPAEVYEDPASVFVADFLGVSNLMDAEPVAWSGGECSVRIGETTLRARCGDVAARGRVRIVARPERLELLEHGAQGDNCLVGMVERTVYVGASLQVIVRLAGRRGDPGLDRQHRRRRRLLPGHPGVRAGAAGCAARAVGHRSASARRGARAGRAARRAHGRWFLDSLDVSVADLLEGKRVCVCAGSGGVGKTTTSAAIALGMAARGAKVAVVTIDPARRLANALGLEELQNEPRRVEPSRLSGSKLKIRGELWAMMLDPKRTFDDLIDRIAPEPGRAEEIKANRIYRELSDRRLGLPGVHSGGQAVRPRLSRATSTCSCSTRRRRATRSTSSTRPAG